VPNLYFLESAKKIKLDQTPCSMKSSCFDSIALKQQKSSDDPLSTPHVPQQQSNGPLFIPLEQNQNQLECSIP